MFFSIVKNELLFIEETIDATAVLHNLSIFWSDDLPDDDNPEIDEPDRDDVQASLLIFFLIVGHKFTKTAKSAKLFA